MRRRTYPRRIRYTDGVRQIYVPAGQHLQVDSDGILSNTNYLMYDESAGKIRMVASTTGCEYVYMYIRRKVEV